MRYTSLLNDYHVTIPNLKRIKIASEQELRNWLARNADHSGEVMLTLFPKSSAEKYISREAINAALQEHGWKSGRRYTLNGGLVGHVVER